MARATDAIDEKNRDLPQAIELLDRIVALQPKWAEAYYRRATALFLLGDLDKAMNDMRAALGLSRAISAHCRGGADADGGGRPQAGACK